MRRYCRTSAAKVNPRGGRLVDAVIDGGDWHNKRGHLEWLSISLL
jgi:hypothetical protein